MPRRTAAIVGSKSAAVKRNSAQRRRAIKPTRTNTQGGRHTCTGGRAKRCVYPLAKSSQRKNNNNNAILFRRRRRLGNKVAERKRKGVSRAPDAVLYRLPPCSPGAHRFSPRPSETVAASFHQRSPKKGLLSEFRGFQCTSMALAAILISKSLPLQNWRTPNLDAILRYGDTLHEDLLYRRVKRFNDPRLALNEIPTGEHNTYRVPVPNRSHDWHERTYSNRQRVVLTKSEEIYGLVHPAKNSMAKQHSDLGYTPMEEALATISDQDFDGVIITVGEISGAVFIDKSRDKICYFDSHCNNSWGRLSLDGTAVLLTFDNTSDFIRLIRKREPRVHYRYELIGLKVHAVLEE